MDLSPLRKWEILGPDAEELLQATMTRDIRRLADGQVVYTALCNDTGGMIDDGTVFRLHATNFRFVGGSAYDGIWLREQADRLELRVWIKESTDELHNVAVQGPASRELLAPLIWTAPTQTPFAELKWFRFAVARLGGPQGLPLIASRTGLLGRARLRAVLSPEGRARAVGRGDGGRRAARVGAARARGARHAAHRGGARVRRLRVRRPGRPVRGGHRLHRAGGARRTTSSARRRSRRGGSIRSARSSGWSSRGTSRRRTATACTSAATRSAWSRAGRVRRC